MNLIEMEGFLRGKCLPGEMKVNETNAEYLVRKFSELEEKLASVAAENAGLKQHVPDVRSAAMFEAIEKAEKIMDDGMPELAMVEAYSILRDSFETPATDRFIADAGIQALEQFAGEQDSRAKKYYEINPGCAAQYECQYAAGQAWYFAECIRKEAAQLRGEKAE